MVNITVLSSGFGLQYKFGKAVTPPGGSGVEVLRMSSAETLFSAAASLLLVGFKATYSTDVAQSSASYPVQGIYITELQWHVIARSIFKSNI